MIKAVLVDDEQSAIGVIESLLTTFAEEVQVVERCQTVDEAVHAIRYHLPEVVFLDVELSDGSGFEVIENIGTLPGRLVFVTAFEHYALKAIKHHAFDYILKPIDPGEFKVMVEKVLADIRSSVPPKESGGLLRFLYESMQNKIAVPTRHGFQYLEISDVLYVRGEGSYARIRQIDGRETVVSKIIKDFEGKLADKGFMRVHKSYYINVNHIVELRKDDSGYLVMRDGTRIPISPKEKEKVLYNLKLYSKMV